MNTQIDFAQRVTGYVVEAAENLSERVMGYHGEKQFRGEAIRTLVFFPKGHESISPIKKRIFAEDINDALRILRETPNQQKDHKDLLNAYSYLRQIAGFPEYSEN